MANSVSYENKWELYDRWMIISRKYRYLFIELPLTASTAIAKELVENYAGEPILYKHANYRTFLKQASDEEKAYFTFIGVRNPMDQAVSHYYKYLNDHKGKYSKPQPRKNGRVKYWLNERGHRKRFKFIKDNKASFGDYFLEFYTRPYLDWSLLDESRMDGIIRFEHIQEDFTKVLTDIGVVQKRPLPQINKTKDKARTFIDHYDSEELQSRAIEIFGPYMEIWGYSFPSSWEVGEKAGRFKKRFERDLNLKKVYWSFLS
ncbi:MAG: hypothetical protein HKN45_12535 [Flavobacteriales bacterium]|nr:hypothetical protein [Flavobacteriales bacterium]